MGATRLASGIKAIGLNKGSQTVLITLMSVSLALKSDAGRVALSLQQLSGAAANL